MARSRPGHRIREWQRWVVRVRMVIAFMGSFAALITRDLSVLRAVSSSGFGSSPDRPGRNGGFVFRWRPYLPGGWPRGSSCPGSRIGEGGTGGGGRFENPIYRSERMSRLRLAEKLENRSTTKNAAHNRIRWIASRACGFRTWTQPRRTILRNAKPTRRNLARFARRNEAILHNETKLSRSTKRSQLSRKLGRKGMLGRD